jgi:aromatic ring hydroxylase
MWLEIFSPTSCFIYRPPCSNVSWYGHFDDGLTNGFEKNECLIVMGDVNIDF